MSKAAEHPPDYEHLAQCLRAARGGTPRREIAAASGVAEPTLARYESGRAFRSIPSKMRRLASFYRWTPDSIAACLRGGEPTVIPPVPPIPALSADERSKLIALVGASELPAWGRAHLLRVLLEGGDRGEPESPAARPQQPPTPPCESTVQLPVEHPWAGTPAFPMQLPSATAPPALNYL